MSDKRPSYEEERAHYEERAAQKKIHDEGRRMHKSYERRRHPCQPEGCKCMCVRCVQARKYNQPKTHCNGR